MPKTAKQGKNLTDTIDAYSNPYDLPREDIKKIITTFNELMGLTMIKQGSVFRMPKGVGYMGVFKAKTNRGVLDYQLFNSTGIKRMIKNKHSGNYSAFMRWYVKSPYAQGIYSEALGLYTYKSPRYFNRYLAKQIKENNTINLYYDKPVRKY